MCGLFGFFDSNNTDRDYSKLVKALGIASMERGTDATGVAYNLKGQKLEIFKQPCSAQLFKFDIPKGVKCVMGHVRQATQGNAKKNFNNHPFRGRIKNRQFALAHNGILWDSFYTREYHELPKTQIECDSYIAVQLLEKEKQLNAKTIKSMSEKLDGSYTITILDDKDKLWFIKGNNPLSIVKLKDGLYVYASTIEILLTGLISWDREVVTEIKELIEPERGDIVSLSGNGTLRKNKFKPIESYIYYGSSWYKDDKTSKEIPEPVFSDKKDQEKLKDLYVNAGYLSITRDQINELFLEGYTLDEISKMIEDGDIYEAIDWSMEFYPYPY